MAVGNARDVGIGCPRHTSAGKKTLYEGTVHGRNLHQLGCKKPCKSWHAPHKKDLSLPDFRNISSIIDQHYMGVS